MREACQVCWVNTRNILDYTIGMWGTMSIHCSPIFTCSPNGEEVANGCNIDDPVGINGSILNTSTGIDQPLQSAAGRYRV